MTTNTPKKRVSFRFRPDHIERLKRQSLRHEIPQARIVDRALEEYLSKLEKRKPVI